MSLAFLTTQSLRASCLVDQTLKPKPKRQLSEIFTTACPDALETLEGLLAFDPSNRSSTLDALRSKFFHGVFCEEEDVVKEDRTIPVLEWEKVLKVSSHLWHASGQLWQSVAIFGSH